MTTPTAVMTPLAPEAVPAKKPAVTTFDFGAVTRDRDWTWISFKAKPCQAVRDALKATYQARWSRRRQAWYIKYPVEADELGALISQEGGAE